MTHKIIKHPIITFKKTHELAVLPTQGHPDPDGQGIGDTGYDLVAVEDRIVPARGSIVVPVGLTVSYIEPGYWFRIEARSGLGFKFGISPHNGIIDNQYRGDLGVKLYNHTDIPYEVKAGKAIAQMVVYELMQPSVMWRTEIDNTVRGENGFNSTNR